MWSLDQLPVFELQTAVTPLVAVGDVLKGHPKIVPTSTVLDSGGPGVGVVAFAMVGPGTTGMHLLMTVIIHVRGEAPVVV